MSKYGIVDYSFVEDRIFKINDLVEKPKKKDAPSRMAIMGRYIITTAIFDILKDIKPGVGGEIQLTDALKELLRREVIYAYNFEGKRYDVGDKLGYLIATVEYALKRDDLKDDFAKYLMAVIKEHVFFCK